MHVPVDGWMQPVVRKAVTFEPAFDVRFRDDLQLLQKESGRLRLPDGHGAKAFLAKRMAVAGEYDAVIFMADADTKHVPDWHQIIVDIENGFALLPNTIPSIACVPMSASESWLLADRGAWQSGTGYNGAILPTRPEQIWGERDDPNGDYPHRYFCRVCNAAGVPDNRDTRVMIAEAISLAAARTQCPISMDPFLTALSTL